MIKKRFRRKCREAKTLSSRLIFLGSVISIFGLVVVLIAFFLVEMQNIKLASLTLGIILALIGITLDLVGEVLLAKDYRKYKNK